ncbi:MAG: hypothetical protein ACI9WU_003207 [Myxococcota bacterium]|jgi:hypothetical protein
MHSARFPVILTLVLLSGCGETSESEPPLEAADTAVAGDARITALCSQAVALPCLTDGRSADEVKALRDTCTSRYNGQLAELTGDCADAATIALDCMVGALACPAGWSGDFLSLEDVTTPVEGTCVQTEALQPCFGDPGQLTEISCSPRGQTTGEVWADIDGDGTDELMAADVVDRRMDCAWDTEKGEQLIVEFPELLLPAGKELFTCVYGTWTGPDRAIVNSSFGSDPATNHHLIVHTLPDDEVAETPDGVPFACDSEFHSQGNPLFHGLSTDPGQGALGSPLRNGQRYYAELHNLNSSPFPVVVNATYLFNLAEASSLEGVAGWFIMGPAEIKIPPGNYHVKASCIWPQDTSILAVAGHMHLYGERYALDWTSDKGTERIFNVDPWIDDYFKADQPKRTWDLGEFKVKAGDVFTTHCTWNNPKTTDVLTPEEMCNTFGVAYPLDEPLNCNASIEVVID